VRGTCSDLRVRRLVIAMLVGALVLDAAYWTIWFSNRDWIAGEHTRRYYDFENAFRVADLPLGMDLLHDLAHDVVTRGGGGAFEALVVAVTWVFSITALRCAWTHRHELLAGAP
jgi:hypothetical protein